MTSLNPAPWLSFSLFLLGTTLLSGCALYNAFNDDPEHEQSGSRQTEYDDDYSLSAGSLHTCALRNADTYLVCWGDPEDEQVGEVDGYDDFSSASAGAWHTCAINKHDATVTCWGRDDDHQSSPPEGINFKSIAGGDIHTCGVKENNGYVQCWGSMHFPPSPDIAFKSIAVGYDHACGIRWDDKIQCWGSDVKGKSIGNEPTGDAYTMVSVANDFTCGIRADDFTVICWGNSESKSTQPPRSTPFRSISSSESRTCGITFNSAVVCWGDDLSVIEPVPTEGTFVAVTVGREHVCAVQVKDRVSGVVCWGEDEYGQLEVPAGL